MKLLRKTINNRGNFSKPPCRVVNSLPNSCRAGHFVGRELRSKQFHRLAHFLLTTPNRGLLLQMKELRPHKVREHKLVPETGRSS